MITIGVDIGTTTIGLAAVDGQQVREAMVVKNDGALPAETSWQHLQDPARILELVCSRLQALLARYPDAACIGVTGQQHGILYLDSRGDAVSPLYTWQDGRGEQPCSGQKSACACLEEKTGFQVPAGYGMATHYYNLVHGLVPREAAVLCTIGDYIAMKLAGAPRPVLDASNAASLGLFDLANRRFDLQALEKAGISPALLPAVAPGPVLLQGKAGMPPVAAAIGDNQASYLGATGGQPGPVLVNVGTGSQFSAYLPQLTFAPGLETRPFPLGGCLLVGASLCGGRAYALLESFFSAVVEMATGEKMECYTAMQQLLAAFPEPDNCPVVTTTFAGTRQDPTQKGSFAQVDDANLTPLHWIWGVLRGITDELYAMYQNYLQAGGARPAMLLGSGNGLRWNKFLCAHLEKRFGCPLRLSESKEEAALGAALFAARALQCSR